MQKILLYSVKLVFVLLAMLISMQVQAAIRTASVTGNWSNTATWGGQPVPTALDDVIISNTTSNIVVTVDIAAVCLSLKINSSIKASTLAISGTNSLQVTNLVTINAGTLFGANKFIDVGSGSLSCASVTMAAVLGAGRSSQIKIGTGTVTITGNLTMNGSSTVNMITFTNAGTLNLGGSIGGTLGGDIVPSTGTVNYNGSSLQIVAMNVNYQYYNLNLNNSATAKLQSFVNATRVLGNISVQSGIFSNGGFAIAGNAGRNFAVADGATFYLEGTSTFPTVFSASLGTTSIVEYNGTNQTVGDVASPGYGYLTLSNSGTKTAAGGLDVRGDLFIYSESSTVTFATSTHTHNLAGNWLNIESVVTGNSTVNFNGSADQYIDGSVAIQEFYKIIIASGSSVLAYCPLLNINNTLTINSTGKLTIPANVQVTATGNIINNAGTTGLVIQSDASGTGSLIHPNTGVQATVQRYIDAANWSTWNEGWHFLSSPVAAQPISGTWTPDGANDDYDFYAWDEPTNTWINFKNTSTPPTFITVNPGTDFVVGRGYDVAYQQAASREFSGSLNATNVTKSGLTMTAPNTNYSFNLLGNPYPCALTWLTGWTLNNVGPYCKIWDDNMLDYAELAEGGIIPAMNGFMVEVSSNGASLTIPTSARTHDYTPWYKNGQSENAIKLTAWAEDRVTGKGSILLLNPNSTVDFDAQFDAHFLGGLGPKFYSLAGDDQLSVNSLPELGNEVQVPFAFAKNTASNFTIELDTKNLVPDLTIYLTDTKTGHQANLTENPVYAFSSAEGDDINRFVLHFLSTTGVAPVKENNVMQVYTSSNTLNIIQSNAQSGKVYLYSLTGQIISTNTLEASPSQNISLPQLAPGVYLVNIRTSLGSYNHKVVIK